ncbi:hypothetical protein V8C43DRAFT_270406 [Trichoderma afarasin]
MCLVSRVPFSHELVIVRGRKQAQTISLCAACLDEMSRRDAFGLVLFRRPYLA